MALLVLAFQGQDLQGILDEFASVQYSWIVFSIAMGVASHYSRALRWNMIIAPLGFQVRPLNSFYAVMVGYLANLAVPRMGEVSRCVVLSRVSKVPTQKLFGTVLVERAIDLLCLAFLFLLTLVVEFDVLWDFVSTRLMSVVSQKEATVASFWSSPMPYLVMAGLLLVATLVAVFLRQNVNLRTRLRTLLLEIREGLTSIRHMRNYPVFLLHTLFIWTMYYMMGYVVFFSMEATRNLDAGTALSTFFLGGLGFAAPVQGGIGAFHWMVSEGLKLYGIPEEKGLVFATVLHGAQIMMMLVVGSFSLLMLVLQGNRLRLKDTLKAQASEKVNSGLKD